MSEPTVIVHRTQEADLNGQAFAPIFEAAQERLNELDPRDVPAEFILIASKRRLDAEFAAVRGLVA